MSEAPFLETTPLESYLKRRIPVSRIEYEQLYVAQTWALNITLPNIAAQGGREELG